MGDTGIGQHPLDVALHDGQHVADDHRQDGQHPEHDVERLVERQDGHRDADKGGERAGLGPGGHEGRDGGRRAFINIGRPGVERHDGRFEAQADDQQGDARDGVLGGQRRPAAESPGRPAGSCPVPP